MLSVCLFLSLRQLQLGIWLLSFCLFLQAVHVKHNASSNTNIRDINTNTKVLVTVQRTFMFVSLLRDRVLRVMRARFEPAAR